MIDATSTFLQELNKETNQPIFLYTIFDYDSLRVSGTATSTSANHLVNTNAAFVAGDVGRTIHNTTDDTYATITVRNSATDVTISKNIMASGEAYDLESNMYLAEYKTDVTFDTILYTASPITHDKISENAQSEIDAVKVSVSNVSRVIQNYLETYNWRGKKVRMRLVWADRLAYTDDKVDFNYYIDSYTANQQVAEFSLLPKIDVLTVMLPRRTYSRNYCQWRFKGTECAYAGAETTCNKTKQRCQELSNYIRFGGFPSIPSRQLSIA